VSLKPAACAAGAQSSPAARPTTMAKPISPTRDARGPRGLRDFKLMVLKNTSKFATLPARRRVTDATYLYNFPSNRGAPAQRSAPRRLRRTLDYAHSRCDLRFWNTLYSATADLWMKCGRYASRSSMTS